MITQRKSSPGCRCIGHSCHVINNSTTPAVNMESTDDLEIVPYYSVGLKKSHRASNSPQEFRPRLIQNGKEILKTLSRVDCFITEQRMDVRVHHDLATSLWRLRRDSWEQPKTIAPRKGPEGHRHSLPMQETRAKGSPVHLFVGKNLHAQHVPSKIRRGGTILKRVLGQRTRKLQYVPWIREARAEPPWVVRGKTSTKASKLVGKNSHNVEND